MNTQSSLIYSVLIFIQILFGLNFSASKIIVEQMDPIVWSNLRFFFAGIGMLILCLVFRRKHPKVDKKFLTSVIPLSILGMALGQGLFLIGLQHTTSINSAILITLIPIMTLIIVVLRRQESLTLPKLIGFLCAFMGIVFIRDFTQFSFSASNVLGDFYVLCAAFCFSLYLSFGKKFFQTYDNMWSTTWMFFISSALMGLINFSEIQTINVDSFDNLFIYSALFSIIGATLLTYLLNNWSLKRVPSANVALFIYLQPVVAAVIGYLFLEEELSLRMLFSGGFIFIGVCIIIFNKQEG